MIVVGAGAVGGVLAALLHEADVDVSVVARGPHLDAIRRDGLTLVSATRRVNRRVAAHPSLAEAGVRAGDVVVLAVKSQDTIGVLEDLLAVRPAGDVAVVCVQNGVDNERAVLRRVADVYGVCVMFPAAHLEPGVVHQLADPVPGLLDIGRVPHGVDATAEAVASVFRMAGFASETRADIMAWKYRKLLMNLGNAVEAVLGPGRQDEDQRAIYRAVVAEGEAVLSAAGVAVVSADEDRARRGDLLDLAGMSARRAALGGVGGSTWQSVRRGQGAVETDYLTGEIVLLGRLHGVATPVNELFAELVRQLTRRGDGVGSIPRAEVMERLAGMSRKLDTK